jgi:hypothetical protein
MAGTDGAPDAPPTERDEEALREQFARLRAELAGLASVEAQLAAARNRTQILRRAVDVAGPLAIVLALLTAFGLANAAAVDALTGALPAWAAALCLAAAWIVVAALVAVFLHVRAERGHGLAWWKPLTPAAPGAREALERKRDEAREAVRTTLEELAPALGEQLASAAVPVAASVAGSMATEAAGSVVDAGSDLLETSDEIVESITVEMPGGGLVNQVWDVVLMPGRWGVKVVTTVLRRPPPQG